MSELSPAEKRIYDYISQTILKKGYSPSVRDIQNALSIKSTSTVHSYLARLETAGYIYKENGKSRTIRIDREPGELKNKIPLLGDIRKDAPIDADVNFDGYVDFVPHKDSDASKLFAYKIPDCASETQGILKNDVLILEKKDLAEKGDTVLMLQGNTLTVKTFDPSILRDSSVIGRVIALLRHY